MAAGSSGVRPILRAGLHAHGWLRLLACFSRRLGESQPPAAQMRCGLAWNCVSRSPRAKALAHGEEISSWETHGRAWPFSLTALSGRWSSFTQSRGCLEVAAVAVAWREMLFWVSTPPLCLCSSVELAPSFCCSLLPKLRRNRDTSFCESLGDVEQVGCLVGRIQS